MRAKLSAAMRNPVLVGTMFLAVLGGVVWISYNASRGIPFLAAYRIAVDVPDAQELVTSDQVRIGGARVGLVTKVEAMPGKGRRRPYAQLDLALDPSVAPLPADSHARVQAGSILGGKYLALYPGHAKRGIAEGGILPLRQARRVTDISQALRVFDQRTTSGLRGSIGGLGLGLASRGADVNDTIGATRRLIAPAERVLRVLAAPPTNLAGFLRGAAATTEALAATSPELGGLVEHGAATIRALNAAGPALGRAIAAAPATEAQARRALPVLSRLLADANATTITMSGAARLLPATSRKLATALRAGTSALHHRTHGTLDPLIGAFGALGSDPATSGTIRILAHTVSSAKPTLRVLYPEQVDCNTFGLFFRNVPSAFSEGDLGGTWLRFLPILGSDQNLQSPRPSPDLHLNFYPHENASECEVGNETYAPGQLIGNPPGLQGTTAPSTSAPADALRRAQAAGLMSPFTVGGP